MNGILHVAKGHVVTAFRERITLFWFLVFPLFLLALLTFIFGNIGQEGRISFPISLVNLETNAGGPVDFATIIEGVFTELGEPSEGGKEPLFTLTTPLPDEDRTAFLKQEQEALRVGKRAALIVIPSGFNTALLVRIREHGNAESGSLLTVSLSGGRAASDMALSIIEQVLARVDQELLVAIGRFDFDAALRVETEYVGGRGTEVAYVNFLLPGVILMGFFTVGLFGVPGTILFGRERKVLRRYWVTPLDVPRYLAGFSLGHLGLCLTQFVLLLLLGRFAFGASISILRPLPILYLLLSSVTFLAFGFFVAAVAKTANAGMAIANILNMPMMFLGGLFFPIGGLSSVLRAIMLANPVTYLAEGLRMSLDVQRSTFPLPVTLAVPLGWIALCTVVASRRLRWDVDR